MARIIRLNIQIYTHACDVLYARNHIKKITHRKQKKPISVLGFHWRCSDQSTHVEPHSQLLFIVIIDFGIYL